VTWQRDRGGRVMNRPETARPRRAGIDPTASADLLIVDDDQPFRSAWRSPWSGAAMPSDTAESVAPESGGAGPAAGLRGGRTCGFADGSGIDVVTRCAPPGRTAGSSC